MWRYEQGDDRGEAALLFFSCENRAKVYLSVVATTFANHNFPIITDRAYNEVSPG